ncbi:hypothetical protein JYG23_10320 [Sedimentibacter sp. zth1]|uniref:hypothetical protein n=1 Tax=Sedimentibacter sp. zth1 TaxID=2816908 RepID=UPI001A92A278|nr:hypothetical protein [Sedimentibacter sp. zth1]QSX05081.1 hypothetical protein JYG23_10320 [Sedimentibacter sp. zth1]
MKYFSNLFKTNKLIKISNIIVFIAYLCLLIIKYNKYSRGTGYFVIGILPFSIVFGSMLACFIRKWYIIIVPFISVIVFECIFKKFSLLISAIYIILLIAYIYLNHRLCFKK